MWAIVTFIVEGIPSTFEIETKVCRLPEVEYRAARARQVAGKFATRQRKHSFQSRKVGPLAACCGFCGINGPYLVCDRWTSHKKLLIEPRLRINHRKEWPTYTCKGKDNTLLPRGDSFHTSSWRLCGVSNANIKEENGGRTGHTIGKNSSEARRAESWSCNEGPRHGSPYLSGAARSPVFSHWFREAEKNHRL